VDPPAPSVPTSAPPYQAPVAPARPAARPMVAEPQSPPPAERAYQADQAWRTAADAGWLAASAAAEPQIAQTTAVGLPKRTPMAQLVPGGVEKAAPNAGRRSPEQVRGLLSAYHRGVQRGRSRGEDASPDSGNPPLGGKEHDA